MSNTIFSERYFGVECTFPDGENLYNFIYKYQDILEMDWIREATGESFDRPYYDDLDEENLEESMKEYDQDCYEGGGLIREVAAFKLQEAGYDGTSISASHGTDDFQGDIVGMFAPALLPWEIQGLDDSWMSLDEDDIVNAILEPYMVLYGEEPKFDIYTVVYL